MNQKRICFIVSAPITVKAFLQNHIVHLSEEYDIYIIANFQESEIASLRNLPVKKWINVEIGRGINLLDDLKALSKLTSILRTEKFDAIHSITPKAGLLSMFAGKIAGTKNRIHIFTGQVWFTKKGIGKSILQTADRLTSYFATDVLVDGASQRKFLIAENIITEYKSRVLGKSSMGGVDAEKFTPVLAVAEGIRSSLNLPPNEVVYMFLGRMNLDKGIKDLALAFNILSQEFQNVTLLLVGFDEQNIKQKLKGWIGDNPKVIFYGSTDEPHFVMQAADVFCLPSHREGLGQSVLEASMLEIPILCSDIYGLEDVIVENETGLKHKVSDTESIVEGMRFYYREPQQRKKMGVKGRAYVLKYFDINEMTQKWIDYYREILNRPN